MPNIQSAKKKVRKDIKRTAANDSYKKTVQKTLKDVMKIVDAVKKAVAIKKAYSVIDKATKRKIFHKNTAARLKSQVSRNSVQKT
ncbi:MAG: 30S ribosomal protein S20 [Candidatus Roizmanbacteria bacterium]